MLLHARDHLLACLLPDHILDSLVILDEKNNVHCKQMVPASTSVTQESQGLAGVHSRGHQDCLGVQGKHN